LRHPTRISDEFLADRQNPLWRPPPPTSPAGVLRLRPAAEGDHAGLTTMLVGLSPDSAYHRFLGGVGTPPRGMVKALVRSGVDGAAWLALAGDVVVAHASWAFEPGTRAEIAELAAVTADAWQGRGLGRRLLAAAATDAVRAGATALRLYVLAGNRRLLARIGREWPDITPQRDGTLVIYTISAAAFLR
jgi:GNAT superfamily N-acetyltransferase